MQTERSPDPRVDQAIATLLLEDEPGRLWAIEELAQEIGDHLVVVDAVDRLNGAGLIHRLDEGFVFASRTAVRAWEMANA